MNHKRLDYNRLADEQRLNGWSFGDLLKRLANAAARDYGRCGCIDPAVCEHSAAAALVGLMRIVEHPDDCQECAAIESRRKAADDGVSEKGKVVYLMSRRLDRAEWLAEGTRRFGGDYSSWRFVCPVCKHVASVADWEAAGASVGAIAFSCIGRWLGVPREGLFSPGEGPCNYAGGGLFRLNPVEVAMPDGTVLDVFEFAD